MLPFVLFLGFLVLPVLEIYVIIQVGQLIGGWQTAALLLAESLLGAWIVRREGRRAWRELRETLRRGGLPDRELADAALVLVGGALLLTPGFITDVFGFAFVLPFTRPLVRRLLAAYVTWRVRVTERRMGAAFSRDMGGPATSGQADGQVVQGKVIRVDRTGS